MGPECCDGTWKLVQEKDACLLCMPELGFKIGLKKRLTGRNSRRNEILADRRINNLQGNLEITNQPLYQLSQGGLG
jgi:hypothetical protein